jgi:uncharacterized protein YggE
MAIGILLVLACVFFIAQPRTIDVNVANPNVPTVAGLSVSATVENKVAPDIVEFTIGVETLNKTVALSQQENAAITEKVIIALKQAGVPTASIQTTNYYVGEEKVWENNSYVSKGYRTTNSVSVRMSQINLAGTAIDAAINAGATNVTGINFSLSEAKRTELVNIALGQASTKAKAKADAMASALGVKVAKITSVSESSNYVPYYFRDAMYSNAVGAKEVSTTPISAGEISVNASVSITFELE